jgi:hypothetical protein
VKALFVDNAAKMMRTLKRGLKSAEHSAFVKKFTGKSERRRK